MTTSQKRVLVVGGGVAGPVAAYWLAKGGWNVTMIDRAKDRNNLGQGIDITQSAVDVVKKMGLLETIKSRTTGEAGFSLCNDDGKTIATLGVAGAEHKKATSLTQEIEIMRGELADIFTDAIEAMPDRVTIRYACTISEIQQTDKSVTVHLTDTEKPQEFDAVIGADGIRSATRKMTFPTQMNQECYKPLDVFTAFYSAAAESGDAPNSRFSHAVGRRSLLVRPVSKSTSSCYFTTISTDPKFEATLRAPVADQKALLLDHFHDFPGLGPRALTGLRDTDNFYFDRAAQIKLPTWSANRVGLIGDAAYAPSGLTGKGTSLAITGAYVCAGELCETPDDPAAAFKRYHARMSDYAQELQTIWFGGLAPKMVNPETRLGIATLRWVFRFLAFSRAWKLAEVGAPKEKFVLPDYCNTK